MTITRQSTQRPTRFVQCTISLINNYHNSYHVKRNSSQIILILNSKRQIFTLTTQYTQLTTQILFEQCLLIARLRENTNNEISERKCNKYHHYQANSCIYAAGGRLHLTAHL